MGSRWESVILKVGRSINLEALAQASTPLVESVDKPIKVMLHALFDSENEYLSLELTAFRRKRLSAKQGVTADLSREVFGASQFSFEGCNILLARQASFVLKTECLYLQYSDTLSSAAYVAFKAGLIIGFDVLGWQGTGTRFASRESSGEADLDSIIREGWTFFHWGGAVRDVDDLFARFYDDECHHVSFVL